MNLNMFNGLVQTDQQFSCSLCYFVGTRDEYERHKTCALHSFNYTLKYFTEKRYLYYFYLLLILFYRSELLFVKALNF